MPLGNNFLRVTLEFEKIGGGARASCALYYKKDSGLDPSTGTIAAIADAFRTAYATAVPPTMTDAYAMVQLKLNWTGAGTEAEGFNTNGPLVGAVSSSIDTLPEESVVEIQRRTGLTGRNKRGRVFWPFVPEEYSNDGGELSTDAIAIYGAVADMIKNDVVASGVTWKAQTPDYKTSSLSKVVETRVCKSVLSRRDRRFSKRLTYV